MTYAIEAENLTKWYADLLAVNHVNFQVYRDEIFGFLGPNGAGKTTTTRMLTGISTPTEGVARILGYDIRKQAFRAKEKIGVVTDLSNVYNELSAWDNLIFMAKLYGLPRNRRQARIRELLEMFGLYEVRNERLSGFSGGMKRRVTIAMALVNDAEVLFLDEPTTGLDVQSVRKIRKLIRELNERGTTVFLTTHAMNEANELCDRVAIINQGKIAIIGTPEQLKQTMDKVHSVEVAFAETNLALTSDLTELSSVREVQKNGDKYRLYTLHTPAVLSEVFDFAARMKLQLISVNTLGPTLEDVFVELTGEEIVQRPKGPGMRSGGPRRRNQ